MFIYQVLIERLPITEIKSAIEEMVKSYDIQGKPYIVDYTQKYECIFYNFFNHSKEINEVIESIIKKEYEEDQERSKSGIFSMELFDGLHESTFEEYEKLKKESIFEALLGYFASEARKISNNRQHLRIPSGSKVIFEQCIYAYKFIGKVEFFKDGGWGIAEEDGTVIIKNHLLHKPSETFPLISNCNCPYRIIQDRDTMKYGVLSYQTFHKTIHCNYDKIEVLDYYKDGERHFILKVKKNEKWGCYDENCALLIDCMYNEIKLNQGYIECIRNGEYLIYDTLDEKGSDGILEGKKDLYDKEGTLLIGGYDNVEIGFDYINFYFGTTYEEYYVEETDFYDQTCKLKKLRLNYNNSVCLALDKRFNSIISSKEGEFRLPVGHIFSSTDDLKAIVPSDILLKYKVDLSRIDEGFIFLQNYYGVEYIVPTYIVEGYHDPEESVIEKERIEKEKKEKFDNLQKLFGISEHEVNNIRKSVFNSDAPTIYYEDYSKDLYFDDSVVLILKLDNEKRIIWTNCVNEVAYSYYSKNLYRIGKKYGFFDKNGLKPVYFDAISTETPDNKIYVAKLEYNNCNKLETQKNPNLLYYGNISIHYYTNNAEGRLIRVEDNWDVFNPKKCKWFPYDFINRFYEYGHSSSSYNCDRGYEWTDEDAWDAMTDGMYGDYHGSGWDPEDFGY